MEHRDNLLGVIETIFRNRKFILSVCGAVAIGSILLSFLLPVYYKATTVFYAASPDLLNPDKMFGGEGAGSTYYYGGGQDIDRLITIAESGEVAAFLIKKFGLYKHYNIDSTAEKAPFVISNHLASLYKVTKTKFDAIELSVEDTDKRLAADIANAAREKIEEITRRLANESLQKQISTIEQSVSNNEKKLSVLADSLIKEKLRYGIINPEAQSEELSIQYAAAQSKMYLLQGKLASYKSNPYARRDSIVVTQANLRGTEEQVKQLGEAMKRFAEGVSYVDVLFNQHGNAREQLSWDKERVKHLTAAYEASPTVLHLVEPAHPPVVKSRPLKAVIVIASVLIALIFTVFGVLVFDNYRDVNWKVVFKGEHNGVVKSSAKDQAYNS